MRRPSRLFALALLAVLAASPAVAQQDPKGGTGTGPGTPTGTVPTPRGSLTIQGRVWVGDRAPDFELLGTGGKPVALGKQRGDWVLLVFARDKALFAELATMAPELGKHGVKVFGIMRERSSSLKAFGERHQVPFELLSDPTGEVSAIYGTYDVEDSQTMPGYVLLDRRGVVKLSVIGQTFPPEQVFTLVTLTIQAS